jgi:pimeloyl-ACP methyl ester carboxylesterase
MKARALRMNYAGAVQRFYKDGEEPIPGRQIVLLVHGFNNDEVEAGDSYMAMREGLNMLLSRCGVDLQTRQRFQSQIWELYWPGYQPLTRVGPMGSKRAGWESAISAASYCLEVKKARAWVADGLANFLTRRGPMDVFFVGHSLGCRVVMEVLKRLHGNGGNSRWSGVRCVGYLLMAAAVSNDKLGLLEELGRGAKTPEKRY